MATGIVEEFLALKAETDADLLTMQCGDFYEFFAEDAETVGEELDLKVSQKSSHGSSYPMAGVPIDDLTPYVRALVDRGYRVAVADQYETDDGHAREITRIVTPGTFLETTDAEAQYLAAIVRGDGPSTDGRTDGRAEDAGDGRGDRDDPDGPFGLAFVDVTTGRFRVTTAADAAELRAELYRHDPAEIVPGPAVREDDALLEGIREAVETTLSLHTSEAFAPGRARRTVRDQFGEGALEGVGLESDLPIRAAGAALAYVADTGAGVLASITRLRTDGDADRVALDATTQRNLELTETIRGTSDGSLFETIDHTVTSAGGRLLREWVTRPHRDASELRRRHDAVEALAGAALARDELREVLEGAYDLERLAARATSGSAGPRQLLSVRDTLAVLPRLAEAVDGTPLADSPFATVLESLDREAASELRSELADALAEDPPSSAGQGVIARGYDAEVDELIERHEAANGWLDGLADREKRRHDLSHVTVDRNKTDGYYIQVGKSAADGVPDAYREIKTLKNSKRFVTEELREREREILRIEEAREEREADLFDDLRERVATRSGLLQSVGRTLAEIDVLCSLAEHAAANDWTRPTIADPGTLDIEAGRHPVVERTTDFVPNDLRLDEDRGFLIVTGPNMSGKSTYMRQAALITLLAQIGSFVPARSARIGLVDGIYTRVGALDELAQGRSTFMVEMQELSNILHSATEESLVILDEVGRGTATYDGISIAWAATEYLHNRVRARTLFATHYHELTTLADHLPRVENVHVAVDDGGTGDDGRAGNDTDAGDVTFLWTVREGPTDRSYGVHVADIAGVPAPVVDRAGEVLDRLREEKAIEARGGEGGTSGGSRDGPTQAVFDLSAGSFTDGSSAGDATDPGDADAPVASDGRGDHDRTPDRGSDHDLDPAVDAVIEEITDVDVNETPPLELATRVQEWQRRVDDEE
ncbi:DNA mismatch repair protein MutS [Halopenitus malekzadehii]|uniref:DNA mismatch repair protein MutS n=1 Tax=Halopenitus malekzadehii TaxID=1267564 RepID=A0A1H6JDG2_9EURY|nr:DNA mismatch repair protein MutS [Halopenitus malekzadehii]SEH56872.1 DNA mismatch repair protein MutS [Halopenitus malekzadehii]